MQTHQDVWFSVSDQQEHIFFRACNQPNPILDFVPWPIRVPGIVFPDGTTMYTAGGGSGVPSFIAGAGISITTGVGTVTISTNAQPQTPWLQNVNGGGFSLSNVLNVAANSNITAGGNVTAGALVSTGNISASGGISSGGNITASGSLSGNSVSSTGGGPLSLNPLGGDVEVFDDVNINDPTDAGFSYRINNIPLATFDSTTGGIDLVNISTINGAAPSASGVTNPMTSDLDCGSHNITNTPLVTSSPDNQNLYITGGANLYLGTESDGNTLVNINQGPSLGINIDTTMNGALLCFGVVNCFAGVVMSGLPTSAAGLQSGTIWNNNGVLNIAP